MLTGPRPSLNDHPSSVLPALTQRHVHDICSFRTQLTGANCECSGHVWRMDVGMSGGVLNALPQVSAVRLQPDHIMANASYC